MAEGDKVVYEFINSKYTVRQLIATAEWKAQFASELPHIAQFTEVSHAEMKKISNLSSLPEVVAVIEMPEMVTVPQAADALMLALDEVQDPGNVGTIIRIADWFGIKTIVAGSGTADAFNPKVVQASMGSLARVEVVQAELAEWLENTDAEVYGAVLGGENIYEADLSTSGIIVIGNEGKGIHPSILPLIKRKLTIPSFGRAESLNAAVATGIICSEFRRRSG